MYSGREERTVVVFDPSLSVKVTSMFLPLTTVKTMSVTLGGCGVVKVTSIVTGVTDPGVEVTPVVEKISLGTTPAGKPEVVTVMTLGVVSSIASVQACHK